MQLIIAEKPSVGRDLARVLGLKGGGGGGKTSIEGSDRVITWCVGHLVELEEPANYDPAWKSWRAENLPMLPGEFKLRPSKQTFPQFKAVKDLLRDKRFTEVVNACDAGREGELIFRYVYELAGSRLPIRRLWISSLTDDAIRNGFAQLKPGTQYNGLADAARCRSEADWLVGMNATRALTVRGRRGADSTLYSIGRVQTPTLAILVNREKQIVNFVPRDYWELKGRFSSSSNKKDSFEALFTFEKRVRFGQRPLADAVQARCQAHGAASDPLGPKVERLTKKVVKEAPPLLFDLTALQRTTNKRFGLSAARTLEVAQALYETHKILTYPRTDSRHLSRDIGKDLPKIYQTLSQLSDYARFVAPLQAGPVKMPRRVFDDAKVSDHHAIIPTGKPVNLNALNQDERRVFDLVVRRFLGAFYPDAEFAQTELVVAVGVQQLAAASEPRAARTAPGAPELREGPEKEDPEKEKFIEQAPPLPDRFVARGRMRLVAGWQEVAGIDAPEDKDKKDDNVQQLPALTSGDPLEGAFEILSKKTNPPPRYTEATLLGAMESAGKEIEDEALRIAMKECGLGTPATRAATIETLLKRGYVERDKKVVRPTPMGIALIDAIPVESLRSPELTGAWEERLSKVAKGGETRSSFMSDISRFVREVVQKLLSAPVPAGQGGGGGGRGPAAPASGETVGRCPRCKGPVVAGQWRYSCAQTPPCGFSFGRTIAGREISSKLAAVLLDQGRTQPVKGFTSKAGKKFEAALVLDEAFEVRFSFDNNPPRPREAAPDGTSHAPRPTGPREASPAPRASAAPVTPTTREKAPKPAASSVEKPEKAPKAPKPAPSAETAGAEAGDGSLASLSCPRCQQGTLLQGKRGWGCTRWREGCSFVLWFEFGGKALSETQLRDLLSKGKTRKASFVVNGAPSSGRLVLDATAQGGAARFEAE